MPADWNWGCQSTELVHTSKRRYAGYRGLVDEVWQYDNIPMYLTQVYECDFMITQSEKAATNAKCSSLAVAFLPYVKSLGSSLVTLTLESHCLTWYSPPPKVSRKEKVSKIATDRHGVSRPEVIGMLLRKGWMCNKHLGSIFWQPTCASHWVTKSLRLQTCIFIFWLKKSFSSLHRSTWHNTWQPHFFTMSSYHSWRPIPSQPLTWEIFRFFMAALSEAASRTARWSKKNTRALKNKNEAWGRKTRPAIFTFGRKSVPGETAILDPFQMKSTSPPHTFAAPRNRPRLRKTESASERAWYQELYPKDPALAHLNKA